MSTTIIALNTNLQLFSLAFVCTVLLDELLVKHASTDDGLSPELYDMKQQLKRQQKELSLLRQRFDAYLAARSVEGEGKAESANKGKKREHSPEPDDGYQSGIKKRVMDKEPPNKVSIRNIIYLYGAITLPKRHKICMN